MPRKRLPAEVRIMLGDHEFDCRVLRGRWIMVEKKVKVELLIVVVGELEYLVVECV